MFKHTQASLMIAPVLAAWQQTTPQQRAILKIRAAYTLADMIVFRYGGFAFLHEGGDIRQLAIAAMILSVAIAAGYSGGALLFGHLGLRSIRSVLILSFVATLAAPLGFLHLPPIEAAVLFAVVHGIGHGAFYLAYFAHMLRHSHDAGRDKLVALTTAQGQFITLVAPLVVAGAFTYFDLMDWSTAPFLIAVLCITAAIGIWQAAILEREEMPTASVGRMKAILSQPNSAAMIAWAAALRTTIAEDAVLFSVMAAIMVGGSSEFGWLQLLTAYIGLAASCRWTAAASHQTRIRTTSMVAALMAVTAWLMPFAMATGMAAFVLINAVRNAVKPVWGSTTTTLEMHLGGDGLDMTVMVVRDTAVGIGRVLILAALLVAAAVIDDKATVIAVGFALVGICHIAVSFLTPVVFNQKGMDDEMPVDKAQEVEVTL
jgi:MFS family permease